MDELQSLDHPQSAPHPGALPDRVALTAMLAVFVGWFWLNTLVATLGSLQHGVKFFDMSAVIGDPTRIFFGVDATLQRVSFGVICLACLSGPLWTAWRPSRAAQAGYFAPLLLMLLCGVLLYSRTSGDLFHAPADQAALASRVIRFANDLVNRGNGLVSRHIAIGIGAYLSLAGSIVLAERGVRRFRSRRESPAPYAPGAAP
jgi:hypothetical protein